jgi:hypothetical protein
VCLTLKLYRKERAVEVTRPIVTHSFPRSTEDEKDRISLLEDRLTDWPTDQLTGLVTMFSVSRLPRPWDRGVAVTTIGRAWTNDDRTAPVSHLPWREVRTTSAHPHGVVMTLSCCLGPNYLVLQKPEHVTVWWEKMNCTNGDTPKSLKFTISCCWRCLLSPGFMTPNNHWLR